MLHTMINLLISNRIIEKIMKLQIYLIKMKKNTVVRVSETIVRVFLFVLLLAFDQLLFHIVPFLLLPNNQQMFSLKELLLSNNS